MTDPCITGTTVRDQRKALSSLLGPDAYARTIASVSAEDRDRYESAMTTSWVPVGTVTRIIEAAAAEVGRPVLEFHTDLVVASTTQTFTTLWRVLLRITTDSAIVQRAPIIWRKMFNCGEVKATVDPGHGRIDMTGWREIPELHILGFEVGSRTIMELAGRREVRSRRLRSRDGARVDLYWQK